MSQPLLEITVAWGPTILDVHHLGAGESFSLGDGSPYGGIEDLVPPGTTMTLARVEANETRLWLPEGVSGMYQAGDVLTPLSAEQSRSLVLGREGRVRAEAGALTLYFQRVEAAEHPGRGSLLGLFGDLRGMAGAAMLHAVFLIVAIALPPESQALSMESLDGLDPRFVDVSFTPRETKEKDLFKALDPIAKKGGDGGETPTDPDAAPSGSMPEPEKPVAQSGGGGMTREQRINRARSAAAELTSVFDDAGRDLFAGGNPLGTNAMSALDGLNGGDPGVGLAMNGGGSPWGGMGPPGGGPGGPGGPGVARGLEPGGYRTRPGRPGPRTDFPEDRGPGVPKIKVTPQTPLVEDGLTRDEIQRVVRLKAAEYRYCYEKQLQTHPDLEGKITLKFVVGPNGRVLLTEVMENTMRDPEVASCIAGKAKLWQFPNPRGGGVVAVKYPFLFRRS